MKNVVCPLLPKAAVELELRQQLVCQGVASMMQLSNDYYRSVKGGSIAIENIRKPASFGKQIGNAIYRGIRK